MGHSNTVKLELTIKFMFSDFVKSLKLNNYKDLINLVKTDDLILLKNANQFLLYDFLIQTTDKIEDYKSLMEQFKLFNKLNKKLEIMIPIRKISNLDVWGYQVEGRIFKEIDINTLKDSIDNPFKNEESKLKYNNFLNSVKHEFSYSLSLSGF